MKAWMVGLGLLLPLVLGSVPLASAQGAASPGRPSRIAAAQAAGKRAVERTIEYWNRRYASWSGRARDAARHALRDFSGAVSRGRRKAFGLEDGEDGSQLEVGDPVGSYYVRLDELRAYTAGQSPRPLLHRGRRYLVPIVYKGVVRSTVVLTRVKQQWKGVGFGAPEVMRAVRRTIGALSTRGLPPRAFLVRVRALRLAFIGHLQDNQVYLTPLSVGRGRLSGPRPASEVLLELVPRARRTRSDAPG